jgi:hypothetical protein
MRDRHWPSHTSNLIVIAMATGFLILHGVENHRPPEHWQFLLAAQLVEHGLEVRYPAPARAGRAGAGTMARNLGAGARRARWRATRRRMPLARLPALVPCRRARRRRRGRASAAGVTAGVRAGARQRRVVSAGLVRHRDCASKRARRDRDRLLGCGSLQRHGCPVPLRRRAGCPRHDRRGCRTYHARHRLRTVAVRDRVVRPTIRRRPSTSASLPPRSCWYRRTGGT